jgi:hypothetical protein
VQEAARIHKLADGTFANRYKRAWVLYGLKAVPKPVAPAPEIEIVKPDNLADKVRQALITSARTVPELIVKTGASSEQIIDAISDLMEGGVNVYRHGDRYEIIRHRQPAYVDTPALEWESDDDGMYRCGVLGDNHCSSKYERRDVLNDLYDRFERAGVRHVFHAGNWIDGEARFNKHDLHVHGVERQCKLLAETYPQREGITTYAITGDDHEGWYSQREGIDIGRYCEGVMQRAGRTDWVDMGFMEARIALIHKHSRMQAALALVHPGGGSTYALSYAAQKIIESLEGGEKPAVGFYGHYHKMWSGNIRNVWCLLTACCQDQTPFMRKNKIEAHVGGTLVTMEQDPESGAIVGFNPYMLRYFARGFYSGRWSHHGDVVQPERSIGGL